MGNGNTQVGTMLSLGYFRSAQISINHLLSQKKLGKTPINKTIKQKSPNYNAPFTLENGALFLSARYNFKHALELSMKSLFSTAGADIPLGHDLGTLCIAIETQLLDKSILKKSFQAWKRLIKKYHENDIFTPNDTQNELDRYMFNNKGTKTFPYEKIHSITKSDLLALYRDIKTAKQLFWKMSSEYDHINYCHNFNIDPEKEDKRSKIIISKLKNGQYITKKKVGVHKVNFLDD